MNHATSRSLLAIAALGLLASACGSTAHSSTGTTAPSTAAATTTAPPTSTTAPPTTTAPTTSTTLPPTGKGACSSASLSVRLTQGNGAAGSIYYPIVVHNVGSSRCNVGGYFGVSVWSPAGQMISADDQRQSTTPNGHPVKQVSLAPGGYASFLIRLVDATCTSSSPRIGAFHFIPPNDTTFDQVSENRHFVYCGDGISVYPVVHGKRAM